MRKINKKSLWISTLTASSFSLIIFGSVAAVAACGSASTESENFSSYTTDELSNAQLEEEKLSDKDSSNTQISLSVRAEDITLYEAAAAKFNSFGKGQVNIVQQTGESIIEYLAATAALGTTPTVFTTDMNSTRLMMQKSLYAKPFVFEDFIGAKNSSLYDVFEKENSFSITDFDSTIYKQATNVNGVAFGMPLGYGLKALVANMMVIDTDHDVSNGITVDYPITSYVPLEDPTSESNIADKAWGSKAVLDSAGKPESTHASTLEDIQSYLNKAGDSQSPSYPDQGWLGWGPGSLFQRIYSLGRSIISTIAEREPSLFSLGAPSIMAFKEKFASWPLLMSYAKDTIDENGLLLESTLNDRMFPNQKISPTLLDYLWKSFAGYVNTSPDGLTPGFVGVPWIGRSSVAGDWESKPIGSSQALFEYNAKWVQNVADQSWNDTNTGNGRNNWNRPNFLESQYAPNDQAFSSGQLGLLSVPYGDIGVADWLSISSNATPAQTLVAKRFMKFIWQTANQDGSDLTITWNKGSVEGGVSTTKILARAITEKFAPANEKILALAKSDPAEIKLGNDRFFTMGFKNASSVADVYNGVPGKFTVNATGDWAERFSTRVFQDMSKYQGEGNSGPRPRWTRKEFETLYNTIFAAYYSQGTIT